MALESGIDVIAGTLEYRNGMTGLVTGGWQGAQGFPFSMEYAVVGDEGAIEYSSMNGAPVLYGRDGAVQALPIAAKNGYCAELEYFVECCRTGAYPDLCPPAESADAVKLTRLLIEAREEKGGPIPCSI
jgi:hypothetical protein